MNKANNSPTYSGSCHCGAVKYKVTAEIDKLITCNCSLCSVAGWQLTFVQASAFELLEGSDAVTDYQFGKQQLHHPFCRTCGVRSYSYGPGPDGGTMFAVNAKCLDGFDSKGVEITKFDGASL